VARNDRIARLFRLIASLAHGATPPQVSVFADTRLTINNSRTFDYFLKTRPLGPRTTVLAAGPSHPFVVAAELARPFIEHTSAERRKKGLRSFTMWQEAGLYLDWAWYSYVKFGRSGEQGILIAGFFGNDLPGIVQAIFRESEIDIQLFVPTEDQPAIRVLGASPEYHPIITEAIRRSWQSHSVTPALSAFLYLCKHEGVHQIGGGVTFGVCRASSEGFAWPIFELDGRRFHRGLEIDETFPFRNLSVQKVKYDSSLFAELEQQHAATPFAPLVGFRARALWKPGLHMGVPLFHTEEEPSWLHDPNEELLSNIEMAVERIDD
jgi:hypothetical protein